MRNNLKAKLDTIEITSKNLNAEIETFQENYNQQRSLLEDVRQNRLKNMTSL
jgi:hypothetical protein